jgi:hypothetical protein
MIDEQLAQEKKGHGAELELDATILQDLDADEEAADHVRANGSGWHPNAQQ